MLRESLRKLIYNKNMMILHANPQAEKRLPRKLILLSATVSFILIFTQTTSEGLSIFWIAAAQALLWVITHNIFTLVGILDIGDQNPNLINWARDNKKIQELTEENTVTNFTEIHPVTKRSSDVTYGFLLIANWAHINRNKLTPEQQETLKDITRTIEKTTNPAELIHRDLTKSTTATINPHTLRILEEAEKTLSMLQTAVSYLKGEQEELQPITA